jgi:HAD superfamily hydrolase (TIGR01509 family)
MSTPAFLFDLGGTLVDSVYQHVLAWREALAAGGLDVAVWRIHRRIGMSGGLFVNALLRETGHRVTAEEAARVQADHARAYARLVGEVRPLPGARELLAYLSRVGVPWAIATSGRLESAHPALQVLELAPGVPVVTRDQVKHAKPDPDLFLAATRSLGVEAAASVVVGDSVWDVLAARRARALAVGLLSGDTARASLSGRARTGCTRTRPTCCATWTRWASARPSESRSRALALQLSSGRAPFTRTAGKPCCPLPDCWTDSRWRSTRRRSPTSGVDGRAPIAPSTP